MNLVSIEQLSPGRIQFVPVVSFTERLKMITRYRSAGDFPQLIDGHIDSYHQPKGHIGLNEKIDEAAAREISEEAGCKVELKTYMGAKLHQYTDVGIKRDKIIHYFAGEWTDDIGDMDNEHSERIWVNLKEAIRLIGNANPKREDIIIERLRQYLDLIDE